MFFLGGAIAKQNAFKAFFQVTCHWQWQNLAETVCHCQCGKEGAHAGEDVALSTELHGRNSLLMASK